MRRKWWFVSSLTLCLCGIFMFIHTQAASTQAEKVASIAHRGAYDAILSRSRSAKSGLH
jgi:glycerophosphoryl diester phosphodiesterase